MSSRRIGVPTSSPTSAAVESTASASAVSPTPDRALAWGAAIVLIIGSLLFLYGGRAHPAISATIGAGADEFFRAFAEKVRRSHGWHAMHMLILVGPLCWAVATPALLDAVHPAARARADLRRARSAPPLRCAVGGCLRTRRLRRAGVRQCDSWARLAILRWWSADVFSGKRDDDVAPRAR